MQLAIVSLAQPIDHARVGLQRHADAKAVDEHARDLAAICRQTGFLLDDRGQYQGLVGGADRQVCSTPGPDRFKPLALQQRRAFEHGQVADTSAVDIGVGVKAALGRQSGLADRCHQLRLGHAGAERLEPGRPCELGAKLAEGPALDQTHPFVGLVTLHHPGQQAARRDASLDLVAAGPDAPGLAARAKPLVEQPGVGLHPGPDPCVGDLAWRRAGFDRQLDSLARQRQIARQPPPEGAGGAGARQQDQQKNSAQDFHANHAGPG